MGMAIEIPLNFHTLIDILWSFLYFFLLIFCPFDGITFFLNFLDLGFN